MQLNLPKTPDPGYFQTHSEGLNIWRSTPRTRDLNEEAVSKAVEDFREKHEQEMGERIDAMGTFSESDKPFCLEYHIAGSEVRIVQHTWQPYPTVFV